MFTDKVSLPDSENKVFPIQILRDTGAAQTIMCEYVIPNIMAAHSGDKVILSDFSCYPSYPLATINLQCPFATGKVQIAIRSDKLPVLGVQMLLGNDLAGSLVIHNLTIVEFLLNESPTKTLDVTAPDLFPSCAVTRSQTKSPVVPLVQCFPQELYTKIISKENLIAQQEQDFILSNTYKACICIRHAAIEGKNLSKLPCFYYQEGVLMRAYRPPSYSIWKPGQKHIKLSFLCQ